MPGEDGYYAVLRALIRSGCDLDEVSDNFWAVRSLCGNLYLSTKLDERWWEAPPAFILDWASFLCSLGFNVNRLDDRGYTLLIDQILSTRFKLMGDSEYYREVSIGTVFMLCLLKADTSIREPEQGWQALHFVLNNEWSAELSSHVMDLAYILIRYGDADVSAFTYDGDSPSSLAYRNGWWDEWVTALERCGIDVNAVVEKHNQLWQEFQLLNGGKSTAIDTDDLVSTNLSGFIRRKAIVGDRLED